MENEFDREIEDVFFFVRFVGTGTSRIWSVSCSKECGLASKSHVNDVSVIS